jgi:hypothetical protein
MYILTQAILAVKVCPKLRRAQFDCELALPNRGGSTRLTRNFNAFTSSLADPRCRMGIGMPRLPPYIDPKQHILADMRPSMHDPRLEEYTVGATGTC